MLGHDDLRTLTVEVAAEVLGVHAETIRRWVREGQLRAARWGGRLHFTAEAVREFQAASQVQVPDPAEFIRRARRGKARSGARRRARRRGPLPALNPGGRAAAAAQPGRAAGPGAAARLSPEQPGASAPAEGPAPAIR